MSLPTTMRVATYGRYGPPDVLRVDQAPVPTPGSGQVLVRVAASSVNDWDYHLLTGRPLVNRAAGVRSPQYRVLGADLAGHVVATGADASRFAVGQAVMGDVSGAGFGAFAEYAVAPESALMPKPARLTFAEAAAVPQAAGLAAAGLRYRRTVRADEHVLINGAGGGVGTMATQMASALGAHVTAVDAAHKLDALRDLGATRVIDYRRVNFTDLGTTYDRILDVTCSRPVRAYRRCLNDGGVAAIIGGSIPRVFFTMAVGMVPAGRRHVGVALWQANDVDDMAFVQRLLGDGSLSAVVDSVVGIDEIAAAFERFARSEHTGKIVVAISNDAHAVG
jgi:NADPH:quinone reductase-like Zn-dependent oxidoreductase